MCAAAHDGQRKRDAATRAGILRHGRNRVGTL
jgi:hypothetical protein